jgi:hypothetical protein
MCALPVKPFSFKFFANSAQLSLRVTKIRTFPAEKKEFIERDNSTDTYTQ